MSKILLLITLALISIKSNAQNGVNPTYNFSLSPGAWLFSTFEGGVEGKMTDRIGLMVRGEVGFRNIELWNNLGGKYWNWGGRLEFRNYIGKKYDFNGGPYWNGWIRAHYVSVKATLQNKDYNMVNSSGFTSGLGLGWKFNLSKKLPEVNLDIGAGLGYKLGNVDGKYAANSRSVIFKDEGLVPSFTLRVGFTSLPKLKSGNSINPKKPNTPLPKSKEIREAIAYHNRYSIKERKAIEKALIRSGFDTGKKDGNFDEKTIAAIKAFQGKNGLGKDGKAGTATLKKLDLKFK